MKRAKHHLQQAHAALDRGDVKACRSHIGHAMAATHRMGSAADEADPTEPEPDTDEDDPMPKHWIAGAIKHPGALHTQIGVPEGKTIPAKTVTKAAHSDNPMLARRANLAKTLKKINRST